MKLKLRPTNEPRREKRGEIPASLVIAPALGDAKHPDHRLGVLFDGWRNSALAVEHVLGTRQIATPDELAKRDAAGGAVLVERMAKNADDKLERLAGLGSLTVAGLALKLEAAFHRGAVPDAEGLASKAVDAARHDALRLASSIMTDAR